jgi:acyl carrier protein
MIKMINPQHSEFETRVRAIFSRQFHTEVPTVETDLLETGILDSLKFVELLLALETELATKLSVNDLELDNFRSIQNIALFLTLRDRATRNGD